MGGNLTSINIVASRNTVTCVICLVLYHPSVLPRFQCIHPTNTVRQSNSQKKQLLSTNDNQELHRHDLACPPSSTRFSTSLLASSFNSPEKTFFSFVLQPTWTYWHGISIDNSLTSEKHRPLEQEQIWHASINFGLFTWSEIHMHDQKWSQGYVKQKKWLVQYQMLIMMSETTNQWTKCTRVAWACLWCN